jgi:hypothetical protein
MEPDHLSDSADSGSLEHDSFTFIVKTWLEEATSAAGPARWRGHITHVPSGERRYFEDLDAITAFIRTYQIPSSAKPNGRGQFWSWLRRLFR